MKPSSADGITTPQSEPKTGLGNFYRAHRTEVLAGGGIIVALFAYWRSRSSSSSAAAANAAAAVGAYPGTSSVPTDPSASGGYSGGYSGGSGGAGGSPSGASGGYGASNNALLEQLIGMQPAYLPPVQVVQKPPPSASTSTVASGAPPGGSPQPSSSRPALAAAEATTSENLAKYRAEVASSPNAKNRAAVTALSHRLSAERHGPRPRKVPHNARRA